MKGWSEVRILQVRYLTFRKEHDDRKHVVDIKEIHYGICSSISQDHGADELPAQ